MVQTTTSPPTSSLDEEAKEFVLRSANQQDVRFVRLWFTDILGTVKGFAVTIDELEHVLNSGASFDGAVIDGLARSDEADTVAVPDPTTWQILPWRPSRDAVASMFCDLSTPDRKPLPTDGRHILRRVMQRAKMLGYNFYVAPELEFFYADDIAEYRDGGRGHLGANAAEASVVLAPEIDSSGRADTSIRHRPISAALN